MIIQAIKLCNFGIYAGEQFMHPSVVQFEHGKPVTLIGGYNGRGKTSLLEAVLLALYGSKSPGVVERGQSYSSYLESLIHGYGKQETKSYVELTFDLNVGTEDEMELRIHRAWHKSNIRAVEKLSIFRDGIEDRYLAENWDTYVEDLVPSAIAELFFFDGERISDLAESDETIESLRQAIRSMLGIELVDRRIEDLNRVIKNNQKRIANKEIRKEIEQLSFKGEVLQLEHDRKKQDIAHITNKIVQSKKHYQDLERSYYDIGGQLLENRDELMSERTEVENRMNETKVELSAIASGALPFALVSDQLREIAKVLRKEEHLIQARFALPLITAYQSEMINELEGIVDDGEVLQRIKQLFNNRSSEVQHLATKAPTLSFSLTGNAQINDLLSGRLSTMVNQVHSLIKEYQELEEDLERIEARLMFEVDQAQANNLLEELASTRLQVVDLEQEKLQLEKECQVLKSKMSQNELRIFEIGSKISDFEEAEKTISKVVSIQEDLKIFRSHLIQQKILLLAEKVFDAFDLLTHKSTLTKRIDVDSETFRFTLINEEGQEIPKIRLSSGERQMLAIAIMWGLAQTSGRTLPVIIDTPMGRLDSKHRMNFVTKYLPKASHQVIVLSTDTEIVGEYFDALKGHIGQQYLLEYDEQTRSTSIKEGYFESIGV